MRPRVRLTTTSRFMFELSFRLRPPIRGTHCVGFRGPADSRLDPKLTRAKSIEAARRSSSGLASMLLRSSKLRRRKRDSRAAPLTRTSGARTSSLSPGSTGAFSSLPTRPRPLSRSLRPLPHRAGFTNGFNSRVIRAEVWPARGLRSALQINCGQSSYLLVRSYYYEHKETLLFASGSPD